MEPLEVGDSAEDALLALGTTAASGPIWLHLLVADRCNHSCLHCYQVQGLKGELSREQIENLLREFRASGGFVVSFSGGEATLRDDLIPLLAYAHELGLASVLYTNGFSMTEDLASAIADCHVWRVDISLYSDQAGEHDAVTRVPGSWAKTVQGIRWLREKRVNVTLKFTATSRSTVTAQRLQELARELDSHLLVSEHVTAGEGGRSEPTQLRRQPSDALMGVAEPELDATSMLATKPCGVGGQLSVRSDGQVQPCAQLSTPMGHIGDGATGLAASAESDVAQFFRQVTWNDLHGCRDCDVRVHCKRCFASAVGEAGDMLAPYRGACELAVARYRKLSGKQVLLLPAPNHAGSQDRDPAVGPYRREPDGNLRPVPDRLTAHDRLLVARHPWLRPSRQALESSACGANATQHATQHDSGLVQLRRQKLKPLDAARIPS
jgi:AdoMet-dependent heme synthase